MLLFVLLKGLGAVTRGPAATPIRGNEVAEREGFEPSVEGLPLLMISSHADSTTLASLRRFGRPVG